MLENEIRRKSKIEWTKKSKSVKSFVLNESCSQKIILIFDWSLPSKRKLNTHTYKHLLRKGFVFLSEFVLIEHLSILSKSACREKNERKERRNNHMYSQTHRYDVLYSIRPKNVICLFLFPHVAPVVAHDLHVSVVVAVLGVYTLCLLIGCIYRLWIINILSRFWAFP